MAEEEPARGAQDRRQRLLGLDPSVDQPDRALADIAMAAGAGLLAEHAEQRLTPAAGRLAQGHEVVELGHLHLLALIRRATLQNLAAAEFDVAAAVESEGVRWQAVTPRPADFLIIGLDRRGHVGVKDEAHVRFVDAHAEGDGRADDAVVLPHEGVLIRGAHGMIEPRVIGHCAAPAAPQFVGQLFGAAARGAVDDPAFPAMGVEPLDELACRIRFRTHRQKEIGPVERTDEHLRRANEEFRSDFRAGRRIGRRCHGDCLQAAERIDGAAKPQILGPKVVPPLRNAMSLVNRDAIDRGVPQVIAYVIAQQSLGRDIKQPEFPLANSLRNPAAVLDFRGRIEATRLDAELPQLGDLVAHERDQGRHD